MAFVSVVIRFDNGLAENIRVFQEPWQMVGTDGVRRTAGVPLRGDRLIAGSVIVPNGFLVGSLTFEVPTGPLELYYTQQSAPGRIIIWTIR